MTELFMTTKLNVHGDCRKSMHSGDVHVQGVWIMAFLFEERKEKGKEKKGRILRGRRIIIKM